MVGLLGALMPGEDPMQPAALVPRGLLEMLGPSVLSRMQAREKQQEARMAAGDRSPTPLDEEGMMLADDLAGGLLGTISRVDDLPEMIARLLREGRAAEVTDDLLGRLTPNQNARLVELYEAGATGMPMPMDEASRMARAHEMDMATPAAHFSRHGADVSSLDSGKSSIAPFDAVGTHVGTPEAALDRFRNTVATTDRPASGVTYPVTVRANRQLLDSGQPWDEETLSQALRARGGYNEPGADYMALNERLRQDIFGEHDAIAYRNDVEAPGSTSYVVPPANIRSRFARFDPRLRNNANLLASIGGLGLLGVQLNQQPEVNR